MKTNIKQQVETFLQESKRYINGNAAEYLIREAQNAELGYESYLELEEAIEYQKKMDAEEREAVEKEIENFITENFNYRMPRTTTNIRQLQEEELLIEEKVNGFTNEEIIRAAAILLFKNGIQEKIAFEQILWQESDVSLRLTLEQMDIDELLQYAKTMQ